MEFNAFATSLKGNEYKKLAGARRAAGKGGKDWSKAEQEKAQSMINKHFDVQATPDKPKGKPGRKPKAKAAKRVPVPAAENKVLQKRKAAAEPATPDAAPKKRGRPRKVQSTSPQSPDLQSLTDVDVNNPVHVAAIANSFASSLDKLLTTAKMAQDIVPGSSLDETARIAATSSAKIIKLIEASASALLGKKETSNGASLKFPITQGDLEEAADAAAS